MGELPIIVSSLYRSIVRWFARIKRLLVSFT
jgi:hypothetical protein